MAYGNNAVEPIAIIGTGCRLPGGSSSPSRLWALLKNPRVVASEAPGDRFDINAFYHEDPGYPGTTNSKEAYYISDDPRPFDASFFSISANEAESIDPQQRQLLETVYESLEAAGLRLEALQGSSTGVFCGVMNNDWGELQSADYKCLPQYLATGAARSIIANRISYFFDWHGPSVVVDTACSSSMVALHLAVTALQQNECTLALATGTNLIQAPNIFISTTKIQMLSPTGRSRMWDADADGYARGEGVISIVLKRLSDAIADGDDIECVIRATGTNQDGRTMGLTMPSSISQLELIQTTYARAGLDPRRLEDRCQYFEAHGTGTLAGDPQEAAAIHHAFFGPPASRGENGSSDGYGISASGAFNGTSGDVHDTLLVGSVKTVVGHTEGTAGLAGIMKATLSLQHGLVAPNLLFETLNPALEPFASRLKVVTEPTPWPALPTGVPRRASVNSFGFGGTNAHAILESYDANVEDKGSTITAGRSLTAAFLPFVFSAASERSLAAVLTSYAGYLKSKPALNLADFAVTLLQRRSALKLRVSLWASNIDELIGKMENEAEAIGKKRKTINSRRCSDSPRILGVFTGQGAQWAQMGWDMVEASPAARGWLEEMQNSLDRLPTKYRPSFSLIDVLSSPVSKIKSASLSQPLCTALQIIMVNVLKAMGLSFTSVVGHSSGEIAAAYAAGYLTATDAIRIAYLRGFVAPMAGARNGQPGAMLAAGVSAQEAADICTKFKGTVALAASNAPSTVTFSGDADAIRSLERKLKEENKFCRILQVDTAYHSHHMQPCCRPYLDALEECNIKPREATIGITLYSSVHPEKHIESASLRGEYWVENMVRPVLFAQAVAQALGESDSPPDCVIEVGPHPALKGPVQQNIADSFPAASDIAYLAPCIRGSSSFASLSTVIGSLWEALGADAIDTARYLRLFSPEQPKFVKDLPSYPFDHSRSYLAQSRMIKNHLHKRSMPHPLLGTFEPESADGEWRWRHYLRQKDLDWLDGHRIQSQLVFPATGYIVMALEAASSLSSRSIQSIQLGDVIIHQAITLPEDEAQGVETLFRFSRTDTTDKTTSGAFHIHASTGDAFQLRASGEMTVTWGLPDPDLLPPSSGTGSAGMGAVDIEELYTFLTKLGYGYSGVFRGIRQLYRRKDASHGEVQDIRPDGKPCRFLLHPALLDCTLQTMLGAIGAPDDGELYTILVPTRIKSVIVNPALCGNPTGEAFLSDANVTQLDVDGISGDVSLFTHNNEGVVQIEGAEISPLIQPPAERVVFSKIVWGPLYPEHGSFADPVDFSTHALAMEHIALLYIKLVNSHLTDDERRNLSHDRHRARVAAWIERTLAKTAAGEHPILQRDWMDGTQADLDAMLAEVSGSVMTEIANVVGTTLRPFFRGEASILEEVRKNDVLTRFYRHDLETEMMNERLGYVVGQLAFRYPRMKILEIGAGTGSATHSILANIGRSYHSYTFTDISVGFFEEARSAFAAHEDRFLFAPLNVEIDPAHQNFEAHSYDLIVAANCLHATRSMAETMAHVRGLLKPGGYLVMLEITNLDAIRTTFLMGGFEGWWAGEKDGRIWGPMLDVPTWDRLLRDSDFGGIDLRVGLGDPKLCLYEVLVAQAVDDRVSLLREPLSPEPETLMQRQLGDLLILGGSTAKTSELVEQLAQTLKSRFRQILIASTLESLPLADCCKLSVLCLTDMDIPCFRDLTEQRLQALQKLISATHRLLWVTAGPESDCLELGLTKGWLRSLAYERRESLHQYLNVESANAVTAELLATTLMRLVYTQSGNDHFLSEIVHATEHELCFRNGRMEICRLQYESDMNQRYLSTRQWVSKEVRATDEISVVPVGKNRYKLLVGAGERQLLRRQKVDGVRIRVQYSTARAVPIGNGFLHLVFGEDEDSGARLIAVTERHDNTTECQEGWTCKVRHEIPIGKEASFLGTVADVLLAASLVDKTPPHSTLFVHKAGPVLRNAIWSRALGKNVNPFFTTSSHNSKMQNTTFIHPRISTQELKELLPGNVAVAAAFDGTAIDGIFSRAKGLLPLPVRVESLDSLYQPLPLRPACHDIEIRDLLHSSCIMANRLSNMNQQVIAVDIDAVADQDVQPDQILNWVPSSPPKAQIKPVTALVTLSANKTYILAGMTGDLGRSICEWMVSKGARHVVLASRTPKIAPEWIQAMARHNARVLPLPMDLADRESVISVYRSIQQQQFPTVGGVVNGALVLEDRLFEEMTIDVMQSTFAAKVQGSMLLDELSGPDADLDFFILFGSITGVVGNFKQTAYSAATGFQSSLVHARRARGLVGSIIHPGLISGVGYITRKGSRWVQHVRKTTGSLLLSERDLDKLFAEAILAGRPERNRDPEIIIGLPLIDPERHPDIFWYSNPLTWDFIDYSIRSTSQLGSTLNPRDSLKSALQSDSITSIEDITPIISEALIAKVRSKFSLPADTAVSPATQLKDLGIDSLVAVDIRTWFARELAVDIPLLQILGGASIEELTATAVAKLPASVFPRLQVLRDGEMH
ncbi:hypothetical protein BDW68DRAFT_183424 [Aspergillus falconensis]